MSIDLVVVNYRTPHDLAAFTDSLNQHPPTVDATLTVVDVATTEAQPTTVAWAGGQARRYAANDNIGYGRACNLAAQDGAGDVIAFFNADVEVTERAIDVCHDVLMARPDWAVIGPRQIDGQRRIRHAGIFGSNTDPVHRGWQETDCGQYADVRQAVTVSGSAYFIKRTVWDELTNCRLYREIAPHATGAFLPTPHYYEETMCSYHCRAHGHSVVYYGPVTMIHKWHRASPVGGWAEQQMPKSRAYFRYACQHHGIPCD